MRRLILLCWFAILTPAMAQESLESSPDPAAVFTRAAEDFDAGRYVAAVQSYESLLSMGFPTAPVYFNLGNAYFRAGDLGRAVWAYRSAALRAPRDPDIEANLTVARLAARDRIEAMSPGLIRQVWRTLSGVLSLSEGARLVTIVWLMLWAGAAAWLLVPSWRARVAPALKGLAFLWAVATLILAARYIATHNTTAGVVVAVETEALSGPGGDADVVFSGHAGLEFIVRGQRADYVLVELRNGRVGWVPAVDLLLIGS